MEILEKCHKEWNILTKLLVNTYLSKSLCNDETGEYYESRDKSEFLA